MLVIALVTAAFATTCQRQFAPPWVMGGAEAVDVPSRPVLHVAWLQAPDPWPPMLVLADPALGFVEDMSAHRTVALVVSPPRKGTDTTMRSVSAELRPVEPLPPGSTWGIYQQRRGLWILETELRVSDTERAAPVWSAPPALRTAPWTSLNPLGAPWYYINDVTSLLVDGDATTADFVAAWQGRVGEPIDYDRPPDVVARRGPHGFVVGSLWYCSPRTMLIPATGGEHLRYGLRPLDTAGRVGPPVEIDLVEARAAEAAERDARGQALLEACRAALPVARARWEAARVDAVKALLSAAPGCVEALGKGQAPVGLETCAGQPAFERAQATTDIAARLGRARTAAEVTTALAEGAALPEPWRVPTDAEAACAAVPAEWATRGW